MTTNDHRPPPTGGTTATSATAATTARGTSGAPRSRAAHVTAWVLQVLLALAMAGAGAAKLFGDPAMLQLFTDIGAGQGLRYLVGALEVAGAVGLLIPRLRALAALGLLLLLVGATITNVFVLQTNTVLSVLYAVVAAAILFLRRDEIGSITAPGPRARARRS